MARKKGEKENRAAQRRNKKEKSKQNMGRDEGEDDCDELNQQLHSLGLALKQVPGDGNCLFRALGDQIEGSVDNHLKHRSEVVNYMEDHRGDFEPFVEDDVSFEDHVRHLSELGTFGGNDAIVAFARLHNLTVVIHQLNSPLWQIHGGRSGVPGAREAHISYHNGDHYNSVRPVGQLNSVHPPQIRLAKLTSSNNSCNSSFKTAAAAGAAGRGSLSESSDYDSGGGESDYENSPSSEKMEKLIQQVSRLTGVSSVPSIVSGLEANAYCVQAAVDYLLSTAHNSNSNTYNSSSSSSSSCNSYNSSSSSRLQNSQRGAALWSAQGSGTRILGDKAAESVALSERNRNSLNRNSPGSTNSSANKRQKKRQQKMEKEEKRRQEKLQRNLNTEASIEAIVTNIKTLDI